MSKKNNKVRYTLVFTILLAIVAFLLIFNNRHSTINKEESKFYVQDTASITKIFMTGKNDSTILMERTDEGKWRLNKKYFVRKDIMDNILKTFYKVRVRKPVQNAAVENTIKTLATSATKVEIYQNTYRINLFNKIKLFPHEKLTKVVYVGFDTQDNLGTVMLLEDADRPYVTHIPGFRGALSSRFVVRTADYRDLTLFEKTINEISTVEVELPKTPEESYKLRNNNDRTISLLDEKGENLPYIDTVKVLRYLNYFQGMYLDELFIDGRKMIDSLKKHHTPTHIIKLSDMDGGKQKVEIYLKRNEEIPYFEDQYNVMTNKEKKEYENQMNQPEFDPNSVYVIFNEGKDIALAQRWVMDKLTRNKSYFLGIEEAEKN